MTTLTIKLPHSYTQINDLFPAFKILLQFEFLTQGNPLAMLAPRCFLENKNCPSLNSLSTQ
jgi:hypothetical protein